MLVIWLGALFVVAGVVLLAAKTIWLGRLSGKRAPTPAPTGTLEPPQKGLRFLSVASNWPGLILIVFGGILLLTGGYY